MKTLLEKKVRDLDILGEIKEIVPITKGGSDRDFYRIVSQGGTLILLESKLDLDELSDYFEIGKYYYNNNISVPKILYKSLVENIALIEDVGDNSLYSLTLSLKKEYNFKEIVSLYKNVIEELIKLQKLNKNIPNQIRNKIFDFAHYRWETNYFLEKCCRDYFNIDFLDDFDINNELDILANSLCGNSRFIVHRDFQSQNIYIRDDKVYVIDFQSARIGSNFYDLASLLKDPYTKLSEDIQNKLFKYYWDRAIETGILKNISYEKAIYIYSKVSLQRLMQALGAYGNLGLSRGKPEFLKYIPGAVNLLLNTLNKFSDFSNLKRMGEYILKKMG